MGEVVASGGGRVAKVGQRDVAVVLQESGVASGERAQGGLALRRQGQKVNGILPGRL